MLPEGRQQPEEWVPWESPGESPQPTPASASFEFEFKGSGGAVAAAPAATKGEVATNRLTASAPIQVSISTLVKVNSLQGRLQKVAGRRGVQVRLLGMGSTMMIDVLSGTSALRGMEPSTQRNIISTSSTASEVPEVPAADLHYRTAPCGCCYSAQRPPPYPSHALAPVHTPSPPKRPVCNKKD